MTKEIPLTCGIAFENDGWANVFSHVQATWNDDNLLTQKNTIPSDYIKDLPDGVYVTDDWSTTIIIRSRWHERCGAIRANDGSSPAKCGLWDQTNGCPL